MKKTTEGMPGRYAAVDGLDMYYEIHGTGVPGDLFGLPPSQLAVLTGTTHITLVQRADWLLSITEFLDAPMPKRT